jgi:hypothetical protein
MNAEVNMNPNDKVKGIDSIIARVSVTANLFFLDII